MLVIKMFGSFELTRLDERSQRSPISLAGHPRSLFAYLALHPGRVFGRSELAAILWSDRDDCTPGALNTTLWRLRKLLEIPCGESFVRSTSGGGIGLSPDAPIDSDASRFVQLVEPCITRGGNDRSPDEVEQLHAGVKLYVADILSNLADDWVQVHRERYRRLYLGALGCLVAWYDARCDYESAIRYARKLLDYDSLREDVHRQLMRLFVLNGQQPLALRQFETCRALLKRELAIQPMRATQELYHRIAQQAIRSLGHVGGINSLESCDGGVTRV
jgi:DNA-binding SARP family transcriptional activator